MAGIAEVYQSASALLCDRLADLGPDELALTVPATPDWTVHDAFAHVVSIASGLVDGDFPASWFLTIGQADAIVELNTWTERMIAVRRTRDVAELADEWQRTIAGMAALLDDATLRPATLPPFTEYVLVTDLTAHQYDIYGALGITDGRDAAGIRIGSSFYLSGLPAWQPDLPGLAIEVGDKTYTCGTGEPEAVLTTDRFTLFRALSGRRSQEQIRALAWDGDPDPVLTMFAPYGIRDTALVE